MIMKKTKKSSPSTPPTSFTSLPYDVVLNCLARISRIHRPTLSLVSKGLRSLIASRELDATRSRMGITEDEDCLYVCLYLNKNPRWFALAPIPKQQRLLPIPDLLPYGHSKYSTIVSIGSNIYIIGGMTSLSSGDIRSRRVLVLDCRSNQWSSLPDMILPRERPAAEVINGKIYVIGGCCDDEQDNAYWGEVYNPRTQTWKRLWRTTLDHLTSQKTVAPGRLVMGGKVYAKDGLNLNYQDHICLVEIDKNLFCQITIFHSRLYWRDANEELGWSMVTGLEGLSSFGLVSVPKLCGGRRLTVWWKKGVVFRRHDKKDRKTEIWCAEISLQRCDFEKLHGVVEWSKNVFTLNGGGNGLDFYLDSAIVTYCN